MDNDNFNRTIISDVKKCRKCKVRPVADHGGFDSIADATVRCPSCGINVQRSDDFNSHHAEVEAVKVWNGVME
jgi:acetylglutamate kinase